MAVGLVSSLVVLVFNVMTRPGATIALIVKGVFSVTTTVILFAVTALWELLAYYIGGWDMSGGMTVVAAGVTTAALVAGTAWTQWWRCHLAARG